MKKKSVILCVDDETIVLKSLATQLGRIFGEEYNIECAENGEEALEIIEEIQENNETLPLIISDQLMPGMKGNELLKKVHLISANTLKILLTGQADAAAVGDAVNNAKLYRYISKPWAADDLVLTVSEALKSFFQERKLEEQNKKLQEYNEQLEEKVKQRTIEIQEAHKNILSSINYASRIQKAMLPSAKILKEIPYESFIFYKPRDIVSGDFYWIKQIENQIFIVVADCTGHGVPGAFMSILGIAALNDIVKANKQNAAEIINELREYVKISLQQTGEIYEQQDGMDISFLIIDIEKNTLSYAGANNSLWLFRNSEYIEFKGDRMPIGIYIKEQAFTNHEHSIQKNDKIYLFSDGYYSQFKFNDKETLKIRRFRQLITEIHTLEFAEQYQKLDTFLKDWQGEEKQIDDILVMGIKI